MYTDEESAIDDEEALSEISSNEAQRELSNLLKGEINDEKAFILINHMICNGYPVDKIEEVVWQLKKYYDDRARYYKNMHADILYLFDRIDNQELEQQDLMDTTVDDLTLKHPQK